MLGWFIRSLRPGEVVIESESEDLLLNDSQLAVLPRRTVLLERQQALGIFAVQEIHQVLFFLDEPSFGQLALEFAQNLLLRQALPPEVD